MEMGRQKKRRKQRKRKHQRHKQGAAAAAAAVGAPRLPAEIWRSTYKTLLQWHQAQVHSVCRGQMEPAQDESFSEGEEEEDEAYEEQELQPNEHLEWDAFNEDVDQVDVEYLKFLEITLQHQQELKRLRAAAAAAAAQPSSAEA
ncbi:uncharacterized protein LOC115765993 [Drosophila novamexicana]|uniref:uncharacterized protein LOC115765993 n=1 Tax=Drosophila novamexicana TaxID=47314 RepID=UPI0011E5D2B1|nr:uncharacterized protein LOC115765993 [Drosophila novamexicana]